MSLALLESTTTNELMGNKLHYRYRGWWCVIVVVASQVGMVVSKARALSLSKGKRTRNSLSWAAINTRREIGCKRIKKEVRVVTTLSSSSRPPTINKIKSSVVVVVNSGQVDLCDYNSVTWTQVLFLLWCVTSTERKPANIIWCYRQSRGKVRKNIVQI